MDENLNKCKEKMNEDTNFLIYQIMKIWLRGKQKLLDEFGLTASQMEILSSVFHLSETEDEVTQIAVSNASNIDPMTTSTILKNLQKKNFIDRTASKKDTRARIVTITPEGRKTFFEAVNKIKLSSEFVFSKLDEEALKKQLTALLNALNNIK